MCVRRDGPATAAAPHSPNDPISVEELEAHCSKADCWVSIDGVVYDVTEWLERHPGGRTVILNWGGRESTDAFQAFHGPSSKGAKILATLPRMGRLEGLPPTASTKHFRKLVAGFESLNRTDYRHYYALALRLGAMFLGAVYLVCRHESLGAHVLAAVLLGFAWQQTLFIGHDAGHMAITHDYKKDCLIGFLVGNVLNGVSINWWKATHNVHHVACNSLECDPDIQHMPVIAISDKFFKPEGVFSLYHNRNLGWNALSRAFIRVQQYTFYPIMGLARVNLHIQSLLHLFTKKDEVKAWWAADVACLFVYFAWVSALFAQLPSFQRGLLFFVISHAIAGLIHVQIVLSHFSRPVLDGRPKHQSWVEMQLEGTMDIGCPWYLDWFHGGLQFQVIHHLWPRVPRHKLRSLLPHVEEFCKEHGIEYYSPGFCNANLEVMATLKQAAKEAKLSPLLHEAFNSHG